MLVFDCRALVLMVFDHCTLVLLIFAHCVSRALRKTHPGLARGGAGSCLETPPQAVGVARGSGGITVLSPLLGLECR